MKKVILAISTALLFSLNTNAIAGDSASVTVIDSGIIQIQLGTDQAQDAVIGLVSNDFEGDATIVVNGATILQAQADNKNKQTARIAVIGCDCH